MLRALLAAQELGSFCNRTVLAVWWHSGTACVNKVYLSWPASSLMVYIYEQAACIKSLYFLFGILGAFGCDCKRWNSHETVVSKIYSKLSQKCPMNATQTKHIPSGPTGISYGFPMSSIQISYILYTDFLDPLYRFPRSSLKSLCWSCIPVSQQIPVSLQHSMTADLMHVALNCFSILAWQITKCICSIKENVLSITFVMVKLISVHITPLCQNCSISECHTHNNIVLIN